MLVPSCELPVGQDPTTSPLLLTHQGTSLQGNSPWGSSLVMSNNTKIYPPCPLLINVDLLIYGPLLIKLN